MSEVSTKSDTIKQTHSKYKTEFCDMLIKHLSSGRSFETFPHKMGVTRSTMYLWFKEIPEFGEAKQIAEESALDFFESRLAAKASGQAIKGITIKDIDNTCLIFALKTRFHKMYGDRQKIEHSTGSEGIKISIDSDDSKL